MKQIRFPWKMMIKMTNRYTQQLSLYDQILKNLQNERKREPDKWVYEIEGERSLDLERIAKALCEGKKVDCFMILDTKELNFEV